MADLNLMRRPAAVNPQQPSPNMFDLRPTANRPLVNASDPATLDAALNQLATTGVQVGLPLGTAGLGGPAAMTLKNVIPALMQSAFGPPTHPDPNLMLGGVAKDQVPEIVYRSTPSPTTDVLPNKDGILYTSPDEAYTKNFGPHTVRLEVAPRKTLDLSHFPPDEDVPGADMVQALQARGVKISAELMDRLSEGGEVLQHFGQYGKKMLVDAIRKAGYDSARINEYVHGSGSAKSLLVFDPKIVKRTP